MPPKIHHITIDCADVQRVGDFWGEVLGYVEDPEDPNEPGDTEWLVQPVDGAGPGLLFVTVPEEKAGKNRIHFDLRPDGPRDAEVERLLGIGATLIDDRRNPDGSGWAVLADPEGNEFCVERSAAERGEA